MEFLTAAAEKRSAGRHRHATLIPGLINMSIARPATLLSGASSGIGAAFARLFAERGHDVVLVALSATDLDKAANEIAATGGRRPTCLAVDLREPDAVDTIAVAPGGIVIALALIRLGVDPAIASGPFVTTVTDVVGFFSFLGIATLWFGLR